VGDVGRKSLNRGDEESVKGTVTEGESIVLQAVNYGRGGYVSK
jgi:hypothetical protein